MSVSVCMFALSTLRVTKFLLKNFTTTTTTTTSVALNVFLDFVYFLTFRCGRQGQFHYFAKADRHGTVVG